MTTSAPIITPWEAFISWFDAVPISMRRYLAHVFRICTTEDTSQMSVQPKDSLERFRNWAVTTDFPLRIAARMFYIRSVFDMVIFHHKEILTAKEILPRQSEQNNIIPISSRQWEEILDSWKELRTKEMSDNYVHSWTSWMINLQMKAT